MDLSIIIVNWNSGHYVKECIDSIYKETIDIEFEIIVVDNASYDGCDEIIKNEFPQVIFKQNKINAGFANANNFGFGYSTGSTLLFLNPDTEIIGSAITTLYSKLQTIENAGAVGCRLLNTDSSLQTSCIQPYPTILNQALDIDYLKTLFPTLKLWGMKPLFQSSGHPEEVDAISGACLMVKRDIFEKVKQFSTDYFMYSEDIDLCYKINKVGYKNYYVDIAKIIHHGGGSTRKKVNNFSVVLMKASKFKYFKKNKGKSIALLYRTTMGIVSICRLLLIIFVIPCTVIAGKHNKIFNPFKKWQLIFMWSIGFEKWTKELTNNRKISNN